MRTISTLALVVVIGLVASACFEGGGSATSATVPTSTQSSTGPTIDWTIRYSIGYGVAQQDKLPERCPAESRCTPISAPRRDEQRRQASVGGRGDPVGVVPRRRIRCSHARRLPGDRSAAGDAPRPVRHRVRLSADDRASRERYRARAWTTGSRAARLLHLLRQRPGKCRRAQRPQANALSQGVVPGGSGPAPLRPRRRSCGRPDPGVTRPLLRGQSRDRGGRDADANPLAAAAILAHHGGDRFRHQGGRGRAGRSCGLAAAERLRVPDQRRGRRRRRRGDRRALRGRRRSTYLPLLVQPVSSSRRARPSCSAAASGPGGAACRSPSTRRRCSRPAATRQPGRRQGRRRRRARPGGHRPARAAPRRRRGDPRARPSPVTGPSAPVLSDQLEGWLQRPAEDAWRAERCVLREELRRGDPAADAAAGDSPADRRREPPVRGDRSDPGGGDGAGPPGDLGAGALAQPGLGALATDSTIPRITRWRARGGAGVQAAGSLALRSGMGAPAAGAGARDVCRGRGTGAPFSGLDTLPALGAVAVCLAIVTGDVVMLVAGW